MEPGVRRLVYHSQMILAILLGVCLLLGGENGLAAVNIRRVEVEGNLRVPATSILAAVSASPGLPFDTQMLQSDVRKLHDLGVFRTVEVLNREAGSGLTDVIYRVRERPFVRTLGFVGLNERMEREVLDQLRHEGLEIHPARPYNPAQGKKVAVAVRDFLRSQKFPNADVRITTEARGNSVNLVLAVQTGPRLEIGKIWFEGNEAIPDEELRKQMRLTGTAHFWQRWNSRAGRYIPEELAADLERVRDYYRSRGFAEVSIATPRVNVLSSPGNDGIPVFGSNEEQLQIEIMVPIVEGPRFQLGSVMTEGDAKGAAGDVKLLIDEVSCPAGYDYKFLESKRAAIQDLLGRRGYALARVELVQHFDRDRRAVRAVYKVDAGEPMLIGRINFEGNARLPDRFLRRELHISEGQLFDSAKLDDSIEKLNRSSLVQEVHREDVRLEVEKDRDLVDVTFEISEKDHAGIYATGGTGGIGGGYLGILYTAFNLLGLGETLSLELDGGASQSNLFVNLVGNHFWGAPFNVALSAFNRYTDINVASIVPGPEDLIGVFKRRNRGVFLSGAYPITEKVEVGLGFQVARDSIVPSMDEASPDRTLGRSDMTPFVSVDETRGAGPEMRGYRLGFSHSWAGDLFLRSVDSTNRSFQFSSYAGDPLTHGRNSFAFRIQAAQSRPTEPGRLLLERRTFPGDETVRGFGRGALTTWSSAVESTTAPPQPEGADTLFSVSAEYRVPIKGAVSGAGFLDFGWTRLDPRVVSDSGESRSIIKESNGVLRASVGGELRIQLPVIHQPARLILSWNPLRLDNLLDTSLTSMKLADPSTAMRFALGRIY